MLILAFALQAATAPAPGEELTIVAKVEIDVAGRITNCAIEKSEAPQNVNEATCRTLATKGRFKPKLEDGKPVASTREVRIRWRKDAAPAKAS